MATKTIYIYRPLFGMEVKQEVDNLLYNATDVLKAYNKQTGDSKMMGHYLSNNSTKEYIDLLYRENSKDRNTDVGDSDLTQKLDTEKPKVEGVITTRRGKFGGTWMNQHLLVDFMMWLSPEFKHKAIDFILKGQELAHGRNKIKEGYKKMCKAIADSGSSDYREEATMLNVLVSGSPSRNQRDRYGEDKMQMMDDLQAANATLISAGLSLEQRKNALIKQFIAG